MANGVRQRAVGTFGAVGDGGDGGDGGEIGQSGAIGEGARSTASVGPTHREERTTP